MKNTYEEFVKLVDSLPKPEKYLKVYLIDGKWQRLPKNMSVVK